MLSLRVVAERNPATKVAVKSAMVVDGDALRVVVMTIDSSGVGTRVPPPRKIRPRRVARSKPAWTEPRSLGKGDWFVVARAVGEGPLALCASQRGSVSYAWPRWRIATTRTVFASRIS